MSRLNLATVFASFALCAPAFAQQVQPAAAPRLATIDPTKVLQPNVQTTRIALPIADGATIAAVDDGGMDIQILDAATLTPKFVLKGHTAKVNAIAISIDGKKLVSASDDRTVRIWDLADGKEKVKRLHPTPVPAVQIFPDGRIASATGTSVEVWDAATPDLKVIATFSAHKGNVTHIALSLDGKKVVSAGADLAVCFWSGDDAKLITSFTGHATAINALGIDSLGTKAVSAGQDGKVIVYDLVQKKELARYTGFTDAATAAGLSPDGTKVVAASATKLYCLDAATLKEMYALAPFRTKALCASFSKDGTKIIASGDLDPAVTDPAKKGSIKVFPSR